MADADAAHVHHSFDYIELTQSDLAAAKRFYAAALGWRFNDYGHAYAGIQGGAHEIGGLRLDSAHERPLIVLYSDDLDATIAAVRKAGGLILKEPYSFPGGRRFHFSDPSGNELAVWSPA